MRDIPSRDPTVRNIPSLLRKFGLRLLCAASLFLPAGIAAQNSFSIELVLHVPEKCQVSVISRARTTGSVDLLVNRYCNVPTHRFVVDYELPLGVPRDSQMTKVNGAEPSRDGARFTDDQAVVSIHIADLSPEARQAVYDSVNVRFEISR